MRETLLKIHNIKYALLITVAKNGWFMSSGWLIFWLRFLSYSEIGVVDAVSVLFAFLLEIPFGALADLIGRKKLLIIAYVMMTCGPMLMTFARAPWQLAAGNFLFLVGFSAQSGAFDAIAFDSLKAENQETLYPKYYAASSTISWIINAVSLIIGGIAFSYNLRLPFLFWGLSYGCGLLLTLKLQEPKLINRKKISLKIYFRQNIDGAKELFSHYLRWFLPFTLVVLGFLYFYDWSFMRPSIGLNFGLDVTAQSIIYAFSSIPAAIVAQSIPYWKRKLSNKAGAVILSVLLALIYLSFVVPLGLFGAIPMVIISMVSALSFSWMNMIVNENVDTAHRATAISSMFMLFKIPYILLAILGGAIIESGNLRSLNLVIGAVVLIAAITLALVKIPKPRNNLDI